MYKRVKQRAEIHNGQTTHSLLDKKRLNILFAHNSLPEYRLGWFKSLEEKANVQFIITNPDIYQKTYGFSTPKSEKLLNKCIFLHGGVKGIIQLLQYLRKQSFTVSFIELPPIDSIREVLVSIILVVYAKRRNIKVGYFWEKWEAPIDKQPVKRKLKNAILRIIPSAIYRHSDILFAGGSKAKEYFIQNKIDEDKIYEIPNCSKLPECEYVDIRKKYSISSEKKIILYFGRIIAEKGLDYLIKAFLRLPANHDFYLLIAGTGEFEEACKQEALNNKLIRFVGAVDPTMRNNYFEQCDVFVFPCTYRTGWVDVWGLTVNEAIEKKKPVIATKAVGSSYDLIRNGVNGFQIEAENVEEIVDTLLKIQSLSSKEKDQYDEKLLCKYNPSNQAYEYLSAIERLI